MYNFHYSRMLQTNLQKWLNQLMIPMG